jgi:alpha-tubulin suppressor-like RCC1 family protein
VKAVAVRDDLLDSDVAEASYAFQEAPPLISPAEGSYAGALTVRIASAIPGATIRYTLDGTEPDSLSSLYTSPLLADTTTTVTARAFRAGWLPSAATVTCATPGAVIHYTTNGLDPTEADPEIVSGSSILVDRATQIRVKAWRAGEGESAIQTGLYLVTGAVSAGRAFTVALKAEGTVWAWGDNWDGQLGDGTTESRPLPLQVSGLAGAIAVAAGADHSLALKADGSVWTWGNNGYGQLGDGTTESRTTPVQVTGLTEVVAVAAGSFHSLALKADGSVWTWGANWYGQLGDGTTAQRATPVQVSGVTAAIAVAGGEYHTFALRRDGSVWAWGGNSRGELGTGSTAYYSTTPSQLLGITGVAAITAGYGHSLAMKTDGASAGNVWAWGDNDSGQVGDGTTTRQIRQPVPTIGVAEVERIAAGALHSLALRRDGTVWAWGGKVAGGWLVPVVGLAEVVALAGGSHFSVAVTADGSVWTWGANDSGQLGRESSPYEIDAAPIPNFSLVNDGSLDDDPDGDGLSSAQEFLLGTDPYNPDTNGDGIPDGLSVAIGRDPADPDLDRDGLTNAAEILAGTDPLRADTDGDGVLDGADAFPWDASRWKPGVVDPGDRTPPRITLLEPPHAVLVSSVP